MKTVGRDAFNTYTYYTIISNVKKNRQIFEKSPIKKRTAQAVMLLSYRKALYNFITNE